MNKLKVKTLDSTCRLWNYLKNKLRAKRSKQKIYKVDSNTITYDPENALVIQARHGFGDNLMVTAVLAGIHSEYPEKKIVVLAKNPSIFANNPDISACFNIKKLSRRHPLRRVAFDLEYGSIEDRQQRKSKKSLIDELYECLPFEVTSRCYKPKIILTDQESGYRDDELKSLPRPLVAIAPYGKKNSPIPSKVYPKDKWEKVVQLLRQNEIQILQIGTRSEGPLLSDTWDWMDLGYRHTAVVLSHVGAVITHVSGIMHLATALDVPCITLFGGIEDPAISGYEQNINLCAELRCAPCWRKQLCDNPVCLDQLSPERIVDEIMKCVK